MEREYRITRMEVDIQVIKLNFVKGGQEIKVFIFVEFWFYFGVILSFWFMFLYVHHIWQFFLIYFKITKQA